VRRGMSSSVGLALPVLAGKEGDARLFAASLKDKKKEYEKSFKDFKIKKEAVYLQQLPGSSTLIIFVEADDAGKALSDLSLSTAPFETWFKDEIKAIAGIDLSQFRENPPPELLFAYGF
jgi:Family of unknown function (DUF6176)